MYQSQHRDVWPDIDQENVTITKLVLPASFILLWTFIKMTVGNWITSVIQHSVSMNEADLPVSVEAGSPGCLVFPVAVLPSALSVHRCDMLSLVDSRVVRARTSSVSLVICIRWGGLIRNPPLDRVASQQGNILKFTFADRVHRLVSCVLFWKSSNSVSECAQLQNGIHCVYWQRRLRCYGMEVHLYFRHLSWRSQTRIHWYESQMIPEIYHSPARMSHLFLIPPSQDTQVSGLLLKLFYIKI